MYFTCGNDQKNVEKNVGQLENNGLCGQPLFGTCIEFGALPEFLGEPLFFLTRQATL